MKHAREDFTEILLDVFASGECSKQGKLEIAESLGDYLGPFPLCDRLLYVAADVLNLTFAQVVKFKPKQLIGLMVNESENPTIRHALFLQAKVVDKFFANLIQI